MTHRLRDNKNQIGECMTPLMAHTGVGKIYHQLVVSEFLLHVSPQYP
jgi:hypothetical protein